MSNNKFRLQEKTIWFTMFLRSLESLMIALYCVISNLPVAFAARAAGYTTDLAHDAEMLEKGISGSFHELWNIEIRIVAPFAAISLSIQMFKVMWGSTQQAEDAKNAIGRIVIGILLILFAPALIASLSEWFKELYIIRPLSGT